jgi:hypothetical protein
MVNGRSYNLWRSDRPYLGGTENAGVPYMDVAQLTSRTDYRNHNGATPYTQETAAKYYDRYDPASDPRNNARELQAAVYEPVNDRGAQQDSRLAERQFSARWVATKDTQEIIQMRLKAGETLLPALNDMKRIYNKSGIQPLSDTTARR